jgi:glutathione synthase/RimK-type ligase-like ATP-grasp enzyme
MSRSAHRGPRADGDPFDMHCAADGPPHGAILRSIETAVSTDGTPDNEAHDCMVARTGASGHIALVTYDARPHATEDDRFLLDALVARGATVDERSWSDRSTRWEQYDAVIVRSCWDYFHRPAEFHGWLDELESRRVRLFNDTATLRWNADKRYLRELGAQGIPVIPTHWIDRGAVAALDDVRERTGWSELVVKPAVSGGAHRTWRSSPGELADDERLSAMSADGAVLVQPLVDEIERDGEWSLIFFDGTFSHAVIKRPRSGDFRVQKEHGGTVESIVPLAAIIADAARAIEAARASGGQPLYARVDGCVVDDRLMLMELELLEPELFLRMDPSAADRLASALLGRLSGESGARRTGSD